MGVRRTLRAVGLALVAICVVPACGDDGPTPDHAAEQDATMSGDAELVGVRWTVSGFLDDATPRPASGPGEIRLEENGYVSGSDGCNGFGYVVGDGPADPADGLVYEVGDDEITFEGSRISTLIGCSSTEYESRIWHVLTGSVKYQLSTTRLILVAADGDGVVFVARP